MEILPRLLKARRPNQTEEAHLPVVMKRGVRYLMTVLAMRQAVTCVFRIERNVATGT
jgi:hypothetical protein